MVPFRARLALLVSLLACWLIAPQGARALSFTHGVASGDVTPVSAVLWTRVDAASLLTAEVSTQASFPLWATLRIPAAASAAKDFTVKVLAAPLAPGRTYYYRFRKDGVVSDVGTFETAPLPFRSADVKFTYTGDADGTPNPATGMPAFNAFETLQAAAAENADFFIYLGDTIYSDSSFKSAPDSTVDDYRASYKTNLAFDNLRNLLRKTSTYAIWDDHEVRNDYAGQTVDPALYAAGRQAFLEYAPIQTLPIHDSTCAGDPLFRIFWWGKDVELIIPDERSCRSAEVVAQCQNDLAPSLPPIIRQLSGLPPTPPAGCTEALNDPSRTMLGSVQKTLLKLALKFSSARFKFIVNEVPIQQLFVLPYDRWEGYLAERAEILRFIRDQGIPNVIFLTADTHATLLNQVGVDALSDPAPIADEVVVGPIATNTFEAEVRSFAGSVGLDPDVAVAQLNGILTGIAHTQCRDLDRNSYGVVQVDAAAGTATITVKDEDGNPVTDKSIPNVQGPPCQVTFGP